MAFEGDRGGVFGFYVLLFGFLRVEFEGDRGGVYGFGLQGLAPSRLVLKLVMECVFYVYLFILFVFTIL